MMRVVGRFFRVKPLQASKLTAAVGTLLLSVGWVTGVLSGLTDGVVLVVLVGITLTVVVTVETLLAGVRAVGSAEPLGEPLSARPLYTVFRVVEVGAVVLAVGAVGLLVSVIPSDPPAGPGALFAVVAVVGVSVLVFVGSLLRTGFEYYSFLRGDRLGTEPR